MPDLILADHAQSVVTNVVAVLRAATFDGQPLFKSVTVFDDVPSFVQVADPLKGIQCGVIVRQPERGEAPDNGSEYVERLQLEISVRFSSKRLAGADEPGAVSEVQRLAEAIRATLRADPFRGGHASAITWNGKLIAGTDVTGSPRAISSKAADGFYTFVLPAVVGWEV